MRKLKILIVAEHELLAVYIQRYKLNESNEWEKVEGMDMTLNTSILLLDSVLKNFKPENPDVVRREVLVTGKASYEIMLY